MAATGIFQSGQFVVVERKTDSRSAFAVCGWAEDRSAVSTHRWYLSDAGSKVETLFRARQDQNEEDQIKLDSPSTPTYDACYAVFTSDPSDRMAAAETLADGCSAIVENLQQVDPGTHPIYDEFDAQQGVVLCRHGLRVGNKGFNAEWWLLEEGYTQPPSGGDGSTRTIRIDHSYIDNTVDPNDTTAFPFPSNGALVIVVWQ